MTTLSLCITCCDLDYLLIYDLLSELREQTECPDEIIISCSGIDGAKLVLPEFIEINKQRVPIKAIHNPSRILQSEARNRAARSSCCDLVCFFDVDDFPHCKKIEVCKNSFKEDIDAFLHSYISTGEFPEFDGSSIKLEIISKKDANSSNLLSDNSDPIHHAHITVRRGILDKTSFREGSEFYRREDGLFCQDILDNGCKIGFINFPLIFYT